MCDMNDCGVICPYFLAIQTTGSYPCMYHVVWLFEHISYSWIKLCIWSIYIPNINIANHQMIHITITLNFKSKRDAFPNHWNQHFTQEKHSSACPSTWDIKKLIHIYLLFQNMQHMVHDNVPAEKHKKRCFP